MKNIKRSIQYPNAKHLINNRIIVYLPVYRHMVYLMIEYDTHPGNNTRI